MIGDFLLHNHDNMITCIVIIDDCQLYTIAIIMIIVNNVFVVHLSVLLFVLCTLCLDCVDTRPRNEKAFSIYI